MVYKDLDDPRNKAAKLKHYYDNKQQYLDRNLAAKQEKREYVRELKSRPCTDCGQQYPYYVMQFDHLDGDTKTMEVSKLITYGWKRLKEEIAKCELVCANCHAERTWQRMQVNMGL